MTETLPRVAVRVPSGDDVGFDVELIGMGSVGTSLARGPLLSMVRPETEIPVRWAGSEPNEAPRHPSARERWERMLADAKARDAAYADVPEDPAAIAEAHDWASRRRAAQRRAQSDAD